MSLRQNSRWTYMEGYAIRPPVPVAVNRSGFEFAQGGGRW
jgi:hypothetical protein